jgi:hypothetical protein
VTKRPEGSSCKEALGSGVEVSGTCYHGSCKSRDAQCASVFSGYSGNWIANPTSAHLLAVSAPTDQGLACPSSDCDDIQCTNTDWKGENGGSLFARSYTCPDSYTCTVSGQTLKGPITHWYLSCMKFPNTDTIAKVEDGMACGAAGAGNVCYRGSCVSRSDAGVSNFDGGVCRYAVYKERQKAEERQRVLSSR